MKIITISDTHSKHKQIPIPKGDIIIHAGDCSSTGTDGQIVDFIKWYSSLDFKYKIMIAGNHDWGFENNKCGFESLCQQYNIIYLNDSGYTIDNIKIWGSPVSPTFYDWAFNRSRTVKESQSPIAKKKGHIFIGDHWNLIPQDTDILITHGPPGFVLDKTTSGVHAGCNVLANQIANLNVKLHIFGHIHETRGIEIDKANRITYVNTSSVNLHYQPINDYYVFDWDKVLNCNSQGKDI